MTSYGRDGIMQTAEDDFRVGMGHHRCGNVKLAVALYARVLQENPRHAGAWHLWGVACQQQGDPVRAVEFIEKAIRLDGSKAVVWNNLGASLRSLGRLQEAEAAYRHALAINPRYPDALSSLAAVLHELRREEEPQRLLEEALRLQPSHLDAAFNLANLCQSLGRYAEAIERYRKVLAFQPCRVGAHNNLGNAFLAAGRPVEAAKSYQEAVRLAPQFAEAHLNLAAAYAQQEKVQEAARAYESASELRPEKTLWKLRSAGLCPVVFDSVETKDRYRAELEQRLDARREMPMECRWEDLARDGVIPSFHLKHHAQNNRGLKEKFAALYEPLFPRQRPRVRLGRRPRIGFLVTRQHEGGFLRAMAGIIEHLDAKRFEAVVLCSRACLETCRAGIRRTDVHWVPFPDDLAQAVQCMRAAQCDMLYHRQVGTDPLNYFLPFAGTAAVQCTAWGSHVTTGISAMDYFLSSGLTEPEGAQEHYSEKLHCFQTLPGYQRRIPTPPATRPSDVGLPEGRNVYFCPGHLAKFHPDQDGLLRGVLEADSQGLLVLVKGRHENGASLLKARLERTLTGLTDRVVFVPWQTSPNFHRLLSLDGVMLDTWHYSASFMAYDAFSLGLPIVTLPDGFNMGRISLGLYRKMGLEHLAARTPEEYVSLAVRLGTDREYRQSVRSLIIERSEVLFEDLELVREHEGFFETALAEAEEAA